MRPVLRGAWPQKNGQDIQFKEYSEARAELIRRLGEYCSYCEMHLDSSLAVEHVKPKKPSGSSTVDQTRDLNWNNFLLACVNCNSAKGNTDVKINDYFWADRDNTFLVFQYSEGGRILPASHLNEELMKKAKATIELAGLDKQPLNDSSASDRRWENRREAWDIAVDSKADLAQNDTPQMRRQIVRSVRGYWSTWMTVFKDDPDMLQRLIRAFPGTCESCFDAGNGYLPIPRPEEQV
ncbi:MAG: HNH endonuclease [Lentisphaerota bacterium]